MKPATFGFFLALIFPGPVSATELETNKIRVDVYPYVSTLGTNAELVEKQLAERAAVICGSLANVQSLHDVTLVMRSPGAFHVTPTGKPGAPNDHIFTFSYPRVTGKAKVNCKK